MARTWRSKYYCPPPYGTNKIIPIPIKEDAADVSCVTRSTTVRDRISKKKKTEDRNSIASDDSKEYVEPVSKKRKTVDHNGITSVDSKEYNDPVSKKRKTVYDYGYVYEPDPNRELPNIYDVSLNEREHKVWLEFMKFDKDRPELFAIDERLVRQGRIPIELDHPLVLVIRDFAVAAFNKNWEMHVKKGDENHIHDFELMERYYVKVNKFDGRLTLSKFIHTNHTPIGGMKGKALSQLRSIYETAKGVEKDINIYLKTTHKSLKGKKKGITAADLICLKKHHFKAMYLRKSRRIYQTYGKKKSKTTADLICLKKQNNKAMKGLRRELSLHTQTLVSSSCSPTNRDDWNNPETYWYSGLVRRRLSVAWGYDYKNPDGGPYRTSMLY
uniref:40S ribosomal protein S13 n=1 Tax=Tanacetum cinerariifolium TaxID=118510 RepID=A0A6L2LWA0_TANCI|nr:40S ribosomal protein S13 [Tanacetum cinerariifolium]